MVLNLNRGTLQVKPSFDSKLFNSETSSEDFFNDKRSNFSLEDNMRLNLDGLDQTTIIIIACVCGGVVVIGVIITIVICLVKKKNNQLQEVPVDQQPGAIEIQFKQNNKGNGAVSNATMDISQNPDKSNRGLMEITNDQHKIVTNTDIKDAICNITENVIESKVQAFKQKMEKVEKMEAIKGPFLDENIQDVILRKTENVGYTPKGQENHIPTEASQVSQLSVSKAVKVLQNDSMMEYTNDMRSNPGESFFQAKIEDIEKTERDKVLERTLQIATKENTENDLFKINVKKVSTTLKSTNYT